MSPAITVPSLLAGGNCARQHCAPSSMLACANCARQQSFFMCQSNILVRLHSDVCIEASELELALGSKRALSSLSRAVAAAPLLAPFLLPRRRLSGPPEVRVTRGEGGGVAPLLLPDGSRRPRPPGLPADGSPAWASQLSFCVFNN
jgi:hypothetical protein